jgi:hypothetical protein
MEIRLVERDSRKWLPQYRRKPGGYIYERDCVDIARLPKLATVTLLRSLTVSLARDRAIQRTLLRYPAELCAKPHRGPRPRLTVITLSTGL